MMTTRVMRHALKHQEPSPLAKYMMNTLKIITYLGIMFLATAQFGKPDA